MKMILAIINHDDSNKVTRALTRANYFVTKLATTGGFLKDGNTTLITGVEDDQVDAVIEMIHENTKSRPHPLAGGAEFGFGFSAAAPREVTVGGATIFVMNVERFEKV
ncbi:MAG: cyclic-di-AMP receptor [Butyricicoccaceae bacterium]